MPTPDPFAPPPAPGASNSAPTLINPLPDRSTAQAAYFSLLVPSTTFADIDIGDSLHLSASKPDGSALPAWLNFNASTSTFTGTPGAADVGALNVRVSATDGSGASTSDEFALTVTNVNDAPTGRVSISGTQTLGQTLTASNTLADLDGMGTVSYQWQAAGVNITGATGNTWVVGQSEAAKVITVVASYTDGYGTLESVTGGIGKSVYLRAYSWKVHTLLDDVTIGDASYSTTTGSNGVANIAAVPESSLNLTASRPVPTSEAAATSSAVNLQDAIAILKMIVGLDVNGAGKPLSPYQALAADFDGNGNVGLTDAIGVLKHVVGLTSPEPTWHFVSETDASVPGKTSLNPGAPSTISLDVAGSSNGQFGLVGYLSGDVDGSFAGAATAVDLDNTQPTYFTSLTNDHGLNLSQFGVYGV